MLEAKPVPLFGATTRRVKKLYVETFPAEQRIPFWALRLRAGMNGMEVTAYTEDGVFCGFSYYVVLDDLTYLYYLAVEPEMRDRGLGGQMLDMLAAKRPDVPLAIDIEMRDRNADNARQREARRSFFMNNGFAPSGSGFKDGGVFEILVRGTKPENPSRYASAIDRLAFGLTQTLIRPVKELKAGKKH